MQVDLTTSDGPAELVAAVVATFGGLDILVNNVGAIRPRLDGFLSITDDEWLWTLQHQLPGRRTSVPRSGAATCSPRGGGTIVSTASVNAFLPDPLVIDYSAAKGALTNFSKSLSKEFGSAGHPRQHGEPRARRHRPVARARTVWPQPSPARVAATQRRSPGAAAQGATGRFTTPQEVADLIVLLASGRAGNVTGSDFVIDGGLVQTI